MKEMYNEKPDDLWVEVLNDAPGSECFVHFNENITEQEPDEDGRTAYSADHYVFKTAYRAEIESMARNNRPAWLKTAKDQEKDGASAKNSKIEVEVENLGNAVKAMIGGDAIKEETALQINRFLQLQVEAATLPDEQAMEVADLYEEWQPDKAYKQGKILKYGKNADGETQLYRVNQDHTSSSEWIPGTAEALYKAIGFTESGVAIWTQPLGAHDAYDLGDEASHNGKIWISDYDANTWEPGVFGWHEKE